MCCGSVKMQNKISGAPTGPGYPIQSQNHTNTVLAYYLETVHTVLNRLYCTTLLCGGVGCEVLTCIQLPKGAVIFLTFIRNTKTGPEWIMCKHSVSLTEASWKQPSLFVAMQACWFQQSQLAPRNLPESKSTCAGQPNLV